MRVLQHVDQRLGKRRDIIGHAAGDEVAVDRDFFIHHVGAGVGEIGADRKSVV